MNDTFDIGPPLEGPAVTGRFAPSPTGALHFGSLVAAVGSYCLARQAGGRWLVRMEDLDAPRVVPGADVTILEHLERLGLCWDGEVLYQSRRFTRYEEVLEHLRGRGLLFPCACSRKEVLASAPHQGEEGPVYPGTCREGLRTGRRERATRIRVGADRIRFVDGLRGAMETCLHAQVGDFVLRRADGVYAYQLAVVVDDHDSGVTQVVRGADLLGSTARQIYLYGCLGASVPKYVHLPLALSDRGEKFSKRHGSADGRSAQEQLFAALRFLGQSVPDSLRQEAPETILEWAVPNFSLRQVPASDRVAPC